MLSLIWAQSANGVIGQSGSIPWRLPEDMAMFRDVTGGSTVLMGRVTWDSLPNRFRPLPDRRNLVLTRQPGWSSPGGIPVSSIAEAMQRTEGALWVIGGSQVYRDALPFAARVVVTDVDATFDGDSYAPVLDDTWGVAFRVPEIGWSTSSTGLRYRVTNYERNIVSIGKSPGAAIPLGP
jgi:dihydrofolate reductase